MDLFRIYFITWNVATKGPCQDVRQLLDLNNANQSLPDMYFIGLQEVKAQPQNIIMDIFFEDPWTKSFREALKEYDYVKVRTQRLQGLVLNMFCLRKHITHLRSIEAQYTKTGFGGLWGNKGAVSIRFNIYGVNICVMNTHLTAHENMLADRISDYNTILKSHSFSVPETSSIFYHDYIFWIGDLNFRLNGDDLSASEIDQLVHENKLDELLLRDQLKLVMSSGEAFAELQENSVTFAPTYKFEFCTQQYDLKRKPSWTDRILYKVNEDVYDDIKLKAEQLRYKSFPSYIQSDHKPVIGEFKIKIRPYVKDHGVVFQPLTTWYLDEENSVSYTLLGDFKPASGDWIGVFHHEFSSLDEYLVYEYVERGKTLNDQEEQSSIQDRIFFGETALSAPGMYCLVYVTQRGDLIGILGVSPQFPGDRRPT
ncbi:inositol polyphosphate 5-phosphatase K-like [Prorops nasuta]|uniref:inositol polyphosphate 5-phosphatase K-like n=1 Tax=Prorops nasuta TaxID=863751 RepID=UPI0034CD697C